MEIDPTSVAAANNCASVLQARGTYELRAGRDPVLALEESIQIANETLELKSTHITAMATLIKAHVELARFHNMRHEDPSFELDAAEKVFATMADTNPHFIQQLSVGAGIWAERAISLDRSGGDVGAAITTGLAYAERAYGLVTLKREVRWDYATLLMLAAANESSNDRRRELATRALSLFEEIEPTDRRLEWNDRMDHARALAGN
jgi:hypothetical protein